MQGVTEVFTGIVEELGTVVAFDGGRVRIGATEVLGDVQLGASIAVNGCCLTVVDWSDPTAGGGDGPLAGWWDAELSPETLERTSLGSLGAGDPVNLERPVRLADRLGGHLVQGHVDAVGTVREPVPDLRVEMPPHLLRYVVEKGSITVDGVSLTVVESLADGFTVAVIPHTCEVTTLGARRPGDPVNLEVDVMAKYAESLLSGLVPDGAGTEDADNDGASSADRGA